MHNDSYLLCITEKRPSNVERRLICCTWRSPSEGNTVVGCRGSDVVAICRRGDITTMEGEGDVTITDVGRKPSPPLVIGEGTLPPSLGEGKSPLGAGKAVLFLPMWGR